MLPPNAGAPRLRNAAATREAILVSACRHFARESYEKVGVREIARDAGVDPALVSRYFGSKEQLFRQTMVCEDPMNFDGLAREDLPEHLATMLLSEDACEGPGERLDWVMIMLRSAASPATIELVREAMQENLLDPLSDALGGDDDAKIRAGMAFAIMLGADVLSTVFEGSPKPPGLDEQLHGRLTRLFTAAMLD
ncbi:TetR family transcriptional regulator [Sphingomonas sp. HF-S3]|jgi:AcrR family transcriptional regulator|uniref:TetR family transcriptional regulator n=1 Tax=Sphingomonas rustica TaxID=3103142 RepID=A0ABV0BDD7_9SPHN